MKTTLANTFHENSAPVKEGADASGHFEKGMVSWSRFLVFTKFYWWMPVALIVLVLTIQAVLLLLEPSSYTARGKLWVGGKVTIPENSMYAEELQSFYGNQIDILEGAQIRQRALERMKTGAPTNDTGARVLVFMPRKTSIFVVEYRAKDPETVCAFVDATMESYLEFRREQLTQSSDVTLNSLTDQLTKQDKQVKMDEEMLYGFQRTNNDMVLKEEGVSAGNYLVKLNVELADLKLEQTILNELRGEGITDAHPGEAVSVQLLPSNASLNPADSMPMPENVTHAREQIEMLKIQQNEWAQYLKFKHPKMIKLAEDIARLEQLVEKLKNLEADKLETSSKSLDIKIRNVEATIKLWEIKALEANRKMIEFDRLKSNLSRSQLLYDRLSGLLQHVDVNKTVSQETVSILERARSFATPRHGALKLAVAGLLAGIAGMAVILVTAQWSDVIHSLAELKSAFHIPIIGCVPYMKSGGSAKLLLAEDENTTLAESFRHIRSFFQAQSGAETKARTIVVASPAPAEGKTMVAANLSRFLTFAGNTVLLIDSDLNSGLLHKHLGLSPRKGINDFLADREGGSGNLMELCEAVPGTSMRLLARGANAKPSPNCGLSAALEELLRQAGHEFDYVVVDTAPLLASAEAATLATMADSVVLVVGAQSSKMHEIRRAIELLAQYHAQLAGLVVNRADPNRSDYSLYKYARRENLSGYAAKPAPLSSSK